MQKNNKYLVVTIWIATIAFIGAGAVGWGSMSFGSQSNSVGKVGEVYIAKDKASYSYSNLYSQYEQQLGGKFDKAKAKELGLKKVIFNRLANDALLLNMANEYGVVVSDNEIAKELFKYKFLLNKDGIVDKKRYEQFTKNIGLTQKRFEEILSDDIKARKILNLVNIDPLSYEKEIISSAFLLGDKIKYKVIKTDDMNITVNENEVKEFWKKNKNKYVSKQKFELELLWTKSDNIQATQAEIKDYYNKNSFSFKNPQGEIQSLEKVKDRVSNAIKLEKIKKQAAKDRSKFKKSKLKPTEVVVLDVDNKKLSSTIWNEIKKSKDGTYLKPRAVDSSYVSIKIIKRIKPLIQTFQEAKNKVKSDLENIKSKNKLAEISDKILLSNEKFSHESKDYITLSSFEIFDSISPKDSLIVIKNLFKSDKKRNKIDLGDKLFLYEIVDQKVVKNSKQTDLIKNQAKSIKSSELTINLLNKLSKKYPIVSYQKDEK